MLYEYSNIHLFALPIFMGLGEARLGTDEKVFIDIFTTRSLHQLLVVFEQYGKVRQYMLCMFGRFKRYLLFPSIDFS